ncbi:MAG: hypothetical protein AAF433_10080 [Bacteroidota bacterium]
MDDIAFKFCFANCFDDGETVELQAVVNLFTSRLPAGMVMANIILVLPDGGDDVPLHNLHVVDIVK